MFVQLIDLLNLLKEQTGLAQLSWGNVFMMLVGGTMIYLALAKKYEPFLLIGIGFACVVANVPGSGLTQPGGLFYFAYQGVAQLIVPPLIFLGVGAMTDFGPMIASPWLVILGAARLGSTRLIDNLELVARGEFPRLRRMCGVDEEDFADMLAELRGYDPKPGLRFGGGAAEPVVPDILISARADGGWNVALNQATLPRLIVNRAYYVEMRGVCAGKEGRDDRGWLSEKLADANWLVKALDQRQKTILKVASEIVRQQDGFFRNGVSHLKPLTLRAVAETVKLHESTVSRVTSNKYLLCERGTFELKYFFTSGVASSDGEGTVSAEAVKAAIKQLIDAEDPKAILSDDTLVDLLKAKGFELARRTVAKYREAIGLGSSVQRRRQKALAGKR
jgi:DNA-directed RNA polymerase specialized sigma54-like protein